MGTIRPQQNQNIFDIALQEYGSIETTFDILDDNVFYNITNDLSEYEDLIIGREAFKKDIVDYYKSRNIKPATGSSKEDEDLINDLTGINFMTLEDDFFVY
ncbi:hypothetical protein [Flavobacterium oreochromis]|uniref:hypothetical protein n=1 Tax=Flavobacterium oreochromis TaxID=2906078 RepID=UPI00385968D9